MMGYVGKSMEAVVYLTDVDVKKLNWFPVSGPLEVQKSDEERILRKIRMKVSNAEVLKSFTKDVLVSRNNDNYKVSISNEYYDILKKEGHIPSLRYDILPRPTIEFLLEAWAEKSDQHRSDLWMTRSSIKKITVLSRTRNSYSRS